MIIICKALILLKRYLAILAIPLLRIGLTANEFITDTQSRLFDVYTICGRIFDSHRYNLNWRFNVLLTVHNSNPLLSSSVLSLDSTNCLGFINL